MKNKLYRDQLGVSNITNREPVPIFLQKKFQKYWPRVENEFCHVPSMKLLKTMQRLKVSWYKILLFLFSKSPKWLKHYNQKTKKKTPEVYAAKFIQRKSPSQQTLYVLIDTIDLNVEDLELRKAQKKLNPWYVFSCLLPMSFVQYRQILKVIGPS